jgi:protein SDA1
MELQTLGDKALREMAFKHIVQSIKRMNLKHKDEAKNRALQNIVFVMLQVFEYLSIIVFCACLV